MRFPPSARRALTMHPTCFQFPRPLLDDRGTVITAELVVVAVVTLIGLIVAFTAMRDAAISELSDVAGAVQDNNQSYQFNAASSGTVSVSGSSFTDQVDHCDSPEDVAGGIDNGIVFTGPTDEGGGDDGGGDDGGGDDGGGDDGGGDDGGGDNGGGGSIEERFEAEGPDVTATTGVQTPNGWNLFSNGEILFETDIPEDGIYTFSSRLWASQGGQDLANANLNVDGTAVGNFDVSETSFANAGDYSVDVFLSAGTHQFSVEFTNDFFAPPIDRNLFVDYGQVAGPN